MKVNRIEKTELEQITKDKVNEFNAILRERFNAYIASGKATVVDVERQTGIGHAFLFAWKKGQDDIARVSVMLKLARVLGIKLTIK